ncbi:trypsin-like serine protease [Acidovorax sp. Root267]|uniref:trypsin-like serine peptidase n=1 Tax=Acidovorax sp. Root267 TaxID=1736505 RepID=UPI0009E84060|nr:trypsin-like serine protease [Acidovorax sp. Root267]
MASKNSAAEAMTLPASTKPQRNAVRRPLNGLKGFLRQIVAATVATSLAAGSFAQSAPPSLASPASMPTASASTPTTKPDPEKVIFRLATDVLPAGSVQLSGGVTVNIGDWPALAIAQIPVGSALASCTATFVGPTVMLTAAHCVDAAFSSKPRELWVEVDGRKLQFNCTISPAYLEHPPQITSPRGSEDYALCIWRGKESLPPSLKALTNEVVEVSQPLLTGDKVLMVGYGCTDLKVVNDEFTWSPSDKTLRIGDQQVEKAPKYDPAQPAYARVRSSLGQEPALCPGDSGGPIFSGATTAAPQAKRRIRAVNSSINMEKATGGYDILSFVSSTSSITFNNWAREWLKDETKLKPAIAPTICGVNKKAGDYPCRQ